MSDVREILTLYPTKEHGRHSEGDFIRLKDGGIMFVYSRYEGESSKDAADCAIAAMFSYDDGETWTEPRTIVHPSKYGVNNVMSVSLIRMLNGDIGLFFGRPAGKMKGIRMFLKSNDEGKTFYSEEECGTPLFHGRFGLNNDRIERLASGRLILPLSIHPGTPSDSPNTRVSRFTHGHLIYSDDDGISWKSSSDRVFPPFTDTTKGIQEGGVIEIQPGILKSYWRTDVGHQYISMSFDNGDHWTAPHRSRFTAPWSPMKIDRNPFNNKLYAIWNPIPLYNGREFHNYNWGRSPFVWAELSDDITTFGTLHTIEDDPARGYCYPAILFTKEDEMLRAYCCGGEDTGRNCLSALRMSKVKLS